MKVLINEKGKKYLWRSGDFSTKEGVIKENKIKNGVLETNLGKKYTCFDAYFADKLVKIKRGAAIILKKDAGSIIANTGINKKSKIVDAGTGSGVLSSFLAAISDNVTSYEKNKEFIKIAKYNFDLLDVKVKVKNKDVYKGIDEKNVDLITLDLLEPWKVLKHAKKSLKSGGYLVSYVTNVTQMSRFAEEARKNKFYVERILENIEREWIADKKRVRPLHFGLMHSGFLIFLRKI